jgi:membrane-bound ClpP family serine protease
VFVFPGHFVSALVGVVMVLGGLVMTFVGREPGGPGVLPNMPMTWAAIQRGLLVVTGGLVCSLILWVWLGRYLPKIPYLNRVLLSPTLAGATTIGSTGLESAWPVVGATGRAVTDLKPGGSAEFRDDALGDKRAVSVVSNVGFIPAGTEIVVAESRGSFVVVSRA